MFGRVPKLPVDFNAACSHDPEEKLQEYLTAVTDETWIHTELYCLLQSDRDILLSPAAWLNDNIMSAVQKLLKQQLPVRNGFQDPRCGLAYAFEIMSDEFIQVLHNGHDHWLTISTIGAAKDEVFVFDSMYASVSTKVKHQIAALLPTQSKTIKLSFVVHVPSKVMEESNVDWFCNLCV